MRLLRLDDDGELSLVEYIGKNTPPYAILSHTWGADDEEVSFKDLAEGVDKSKAGYKKIRFCGKQAAKDGLQYFWVDTCCIDKSSSAELSEAINSSFRWYQDAAQCYVYLSDISVGGSIRSGLSSQQTWIAAFRHSRWFTRCWTLQELLAPGYVIFFSAEGERLGDKASLVQEIHDITGVPIEALQGSPLSQFSVNERMSWAERRRALHEEDAAYSLLGIFDVHMPLIYGEGRELAFIRLREEILKAEHRSRTSSQYKDWGKETGLTSNLDIHQISTTNEFKTGIDEILDTDSDAGTDIASIFSDGGISASSASTASLNQVQTTGIREVSQALLSQEDLKALYTTAVRNIERRKARAHIRGFLKEYGQNLLKEASNRSLEIQAAKFVQELAGRIVDEISWSITGFKEVSRSLETGLAKKGLETWLSSLQPQSVDVEKEPKPSGLAATVDEMFEEGDSDEEFDNGLLFPNIDKVKDFLLNSKAFGTHVAAMRTWLKVDGGHGRDVEKHKPVMSEIMEKPTGSMPADSAASGLGQQQTEHSGKPTTKAKINSQQDTAQEPKSRSILRQNRGSVSDLVSGLLNFWGISFFFFDLVELFVPRVRPGYKRLRWRCSCNTVLWGDFPVDDDYALDQLKRELSWWSVPFTRHAPSGGTSTADSAAGVPGAIHLGPMYSMGPSPELEGVQSASSSSQKPTNVSNPSLSGATHIVNIAFSPKYFEVCVNIGNYAIDHHEIDISRVNSDSELFELIWDKYNSSRSIGLRRLFLRPRNVHFVMFSVGRRTQYGAGIHKKPDEFPPQEELDRKRYHYLCPKTRMPVNVFLHYLHRARWNIWGEHTEDTWLQRLPKKLNESILAEVRQDNANNQQDGQEAIMDPNLAFGWGVHILDGPNHAVLGLLLFIGVAVAFVISGMVVGFAKTQEQGFGVGNFLLAILASIMAAIYFQLQDQ